MIYNNHDSISIENLLVSSGSNLNYQNVNGYTALMVGKLKSLDHKLKIVYYFYIFSACKFNTINIVNILIQGRANLDIGDANGQTALMGGNL